MGSELEQRSDVKMEAVLDASEPSTSDGYDGTRMPLDSDVKRMPCASNYEDTVFDVDNSADAGQKKELYGESVEVDILNEDPKSGDLLQVKEPVIGQDSTEYSSSFSGTLSGADNGSALSDGEVSSQYFDGGKPDYYNPGIYEGFTMRKKRLTDHWRRFISPIRWRCTWLELQIKELESRALQYDKELEQYEERKQALLENSTPEVFDSKSLAFSGKIPRINIMKRRKRKRIEETIDIASYLSNHNLFSYDEKKSSSEKALPKDGNANHANADGIHSSGVNDSLYLRDGDTSMEQILGKIVMAQSQIHLLKARIEKVIGDNPGKFLSVNILSSGSPDSTGNISDEEPASPPAKGQLSLAKSLDAASWHAAEGDMGDILLGDPIDCRGIIALPDVIESTNQIEDGVLINNREAKEELIDLTNFGDEQEKKPGGMLERQKQEVPMSAVAETALPVETPSVLEASNVKSRPLLKTYISNKKKKRKIGAASRRKTKRLSG